MPQTREAAAHIQAANCRYVVALTKCDRDGADPARVREELIKMGLPLEEAGGKVGHFYFPRSFAVKTRFS
jgi:translation initiation factor IF-2